MSTGTQSGRRRLYLYWRIARDDLPAVRRAVSELHARWHRQARGLHSTLLLRADDAGEATLMEIHTLDARSAVAGIDVGLQQRIVDEGDAALRPWLRGPRHLEVFDVLEG